MKKNWSVKLINPSLEKIFMQLSKSISFNKYSLQNKITKQNNIETITAELLIISEFNVQFVSTLYIFYTSYVSGWNNGMVVWA